MYSIYINKDCLASSARKLALGLSQADTQAVDAAILSVGSRSPADYATKGIYFSQDNGSTLFLNKNVLSKSSVGKRLLYYMQW